MIERKLISESRPPCPPLARVPKGCAQLWLHNSCVSLGAKLLPRDLFDRRHQHGGAVERENDQSSGL